jgi:hypothetical protein
MMERKKCSKCGEKKPPSEFNTYKTKKCGDKPRSECRLCENERKAKWKRQYLEKNKKTAICPDCGIIFHKTGPRYRCDDCAAMFKRRSSTNRATQWNKKNKTRRRMYQELLPDAYVKKLLENRGFKRADITPELIKAHRALVKLKRTIKEIDNGNKNSQRHGSNAV